MKPNGHRANKPFTARSLVGMTMGARKRRARAVAYIYIDEVPFVDVAERWANKRHARWFHQRGFPRHKDDLIAYQHVRAKYRIGQRLRPCPGCANCDPYMGSYGSFYCGDPRNFTPDEECSTEEERELHRQHCEAWAKGERPTVKVSGIEWTEAINYTGRDGKPKTCPAGYAFVERAAYGLGSTRATNDKDGRFCDGSGVMPARKAKR